MSHTPGPWKAEKATASGVWNIVRADDPDELWLGEIWTSNADARLIAAAPDLLETAVANLATYDHLADCSECDNKLCDTATKLSRHAYRITQAVIAKAQGQTP